MDSQSEKNVPIPVLELKENQENQIRLKVKNLSLVLSIKMVSHGWSLTVKTQVQIIHGSF